MTVGGTETAEGPQCHCRSTVRRHLGCGCASSALRRCHPDCRGLETTSPELTGSDATSPGRRACRTHRWPVKFVRTWYFICPMGRRTLSSESIRHTGPKSCESSSLSFHAPARYRSGSERVKEHRVIPKNLTMHTHKAARLAGPCLYLGCGTLGSLLADLRGLAPCGRGRALRLLGLLLGLSGGLLLLSLLDGG